MGSDRCRVKQSAVNYQLRLDRKGSTAAQIKDEQDEEAEYESNHHRFSDVFGEGSGRQYHPRPTGSLALGRFSLPETRSSRFDDQAAFVEPEDIAELSRIDAALEGADGDSDMFDLGSTEAQMLEARTSPVKDALTHREDNHFFESHDVGNIAELERRMDASDEGNHPNKKTKLRLAVPTKAADKERSAKLARSKKASLEMHFTYGLGIDRKPIPSRFDWRQRATSRTKKPRGAGIKQRIQPPSARNQNDDRWGDAIEAYSEK